MNLPRQGRPKLTSSIDRLLAEPHRFSFFQAMRLLEQWLERAPDGAASLAQRVRFRNSLSLAFPPSEIASLRAFAASGGAVTARDIDRVAHIEIVPAFAGFLGVSGALPPFYTRLFAEHELQHRDGSARGFLDIFLQRAMLLFYAAWRKQRLALQFEADRELHFKPMVLSLVGFGEPALRDRLQPERGGVADSTVAYYAGLLRHRPLSAVALQGVLAEYFGVPVRIESFVGRWLPLPAENQSSPGLCHSVLGRNAVVGERVWQRDLRLRLTLGPLTRPRFVRFLPGGAAALALRELLLLVCGVTLEYEVRLLLRAAEVSPARLDERREAAPDESAGAWLGWDTFLADPAQPSPEDRADPGYALLAA